MICSTKNSEWTDAKNSIKSAICCSKPNRPLLRRPFRSKATYSLLPATTVMLSGPKSIMQIVHSGFYRFRLLQFRVLQIPGFTIPGFHIFRLLQFRVLQIPAFTIPGFTDSGFYNSGFYRFRLLQFRVLQIPAFTIPGFTDSGFYNSGFYRFRLLQFRVLQIPAFTIPGFTDSGFYNSGFSHSPFHSSFHSLIPRSGFYR